MPRKSSAILLAIWALVMLPTLCVGGFIGHPCDCPSGTACDHEEGCDDDPCLRLAAAVRQRSVETDVKPAPWLADAERVDTPAWLDPLASARPALTPILYRVHRPFEPSDIPLRI